jgi:hypothetical protein
VTRLTVRYTACCDREYTYPDPLPDDPLGSPLLGLRIMAWADAAHDADHPTGRSRITAARPAPAGG